MTTSYIGYAVDYRIRNTATSGGIGSALLKYMFENNFIHTGITFSYNNSTLRYLPNLIYCFDDYQITGSIYHEIDLINFIKKNYNLIKGTIFLFALPCQVKPIKIFLGKMGINCFICSLTCSSQQTIDATYYLLKRLNIPKANVRDIKYRGDGWPGGIKIELKRGKSIFVPNNNSIWMKIFHSRLFIQKKCFKCNDTLSSNSDITLADPWLKEYINIERVGQSLIVVNSSDGLHYLEKANENKSIHIKPIDIYEVRNSQLATILRKQAYSNNKKAIRFLIRILNFSIYRYLAQWNNFFFHIHCILIHKIESKLK